MAKAIFCEKISACRINTVPYALNKYDYNEYNYILIALCLKQRLL